MVTGNMCKRRSINVSRCVYIYMYVRVLTSLKLLLLLLIKQTPKRQYGAHNVLDRRPCA